MFGAFIQCPQFLLGRSSKNQMVEPVLYNFFAKFWHRCNFYVMTSFFNPCAKGSIGRKWLTNMFVVIKMRNVNSLIEVPVCLVTPIVRLEYSLKVLQKLCCGNGQLIS